KEETEKKYEPLKDLLNEWVMGEGLSPATTETNAAGGVHVGAVEAIQQNRWNASTREEVGKEFEILHDGFNFLYDRVKKEVVSSGKAKQASEIIVNGVRELKDTCSALQDVERGLLPEEYQKLLRTSSSPDAIFLKCLGDMRNNRMEVDINGEILTGAAK